jgi:hypothetical protein
VSNAYPKTYDVFRQDESGMQWVEATETFEQAEELADELVCVRSCSCFIINIHTGATHMISPDDGSLELKLVAAPI